ncbi:MAG TPA: glycosyltransferase family 2 protein, partial [Aggregatilineales bacterium]|nr:glycosyltransferase family 2 protein [Aggregatilineales bacterium]
MSIWFILIALPLTIISLNMLLNLIIFPRLSAKSSTETPFVSVMIPARNESAVIANTVSAWLSQTYPHYEILLLDDHSTDNTAQIARDAGGDCDRLRILSGAPLPDGWMGKNWACHQMAGVAKGDILLFTDADVRWSPEGLNALVADMTARHADLYSVWSTQETVTWGERLVVPLMALVILGYLPLIGVHYIPLGIFGAANGQCMAWRKSAYQQIGGHERVKGNVLEDVTLARMVKSAKLRLRMADGAGLVTCRMYQNWHEVKNGYAKNILAGYGSPLALIVGTIFHWLIFIVPVLWLIGALITG